MGDNDDKIGEIGRGFPATSTYARYRPARMPADAHARNSVPRGENIGFCADCRIATVERLPPLHLYLPRFLICRFALIPLWHLRAQYVGIKS